MQIYSAAITEEKGKIIVWGLGICVCKSTDVSAWKRAHVAAEKDARKYFKNGKPIAELKTVSCTHLAYTYADEYGAMDGQPNPLLLNSENKLLYLKGEEKYPVYGEAAKKEFRYVYIHGRKPRYFDGGTYVVSPNSIQWKLNNFINLNPKSWSFIFALLYGGLLYLILVVLNFYIKGGCK